MVYEITVNGKSSSVELKQSAEAPNQWICIMAGKEIRLDIVEVGEDVLSILINGRVYEVKRDFRPNEKRIFVGGAAFACEIRDPRGLRGRRSSGAGLGGPKKITAPMPGKVVRVIAPSGTSVEAGQGVIVIEAMKMQNELKSPKTGVVKKILAAEGAPVNAGDTLAIIE